jgi:hypothetical protein
MDECDRYIDPRYEPIRRELPLGDLDVAGETRCRACGSASFEQLGTATVACQVKTVVGFGREVLVLQASEVVYVDEDFEPVGYRCSSCGLEDCDLGNIAESSPWTIGARVVLPDETEARVEAIGPDRIVGNHREPTAICAGTTYLLRDLRAIDHVHAYQLALLV